MNYNSEMKTDVSSERVLPFKRTWTPKEDATILRMVEEHGASNWGLIATGLVARTGKQCRERYHNHLQPNVKKGDWTEEEDRLILELQARYGNQWAKITKELPGRTDNAVKNRWHAAMRSQAKRTEMQNKSQSSVATVVPKLPLGQNANLCSSSGALSGRREDIPSIEEIVRKYSPRFESEMHLANSVDLNMVSHGHHMHAHDPVTARSDCSRENTPRVTVSFSGPSNALGSLLIATSSGTNVAENTVVPTEQDLKELNAIMQLPTARPLETSAVTSAPSVVSEEFLAKWARIEDECSLVSSDSDGESMVGSDANVISTTDFHSYFGEDDAEGDLDLTNFYSPRISPRVSHRSHSNHRNMGLATNATKGVNRKRNMGTAKMTDSGAIKKKSRGAVAAATEAMVFDCSFFDVQLDGFSDNMCF